MRGGCVLVADTYAGNIGDRNRKTAEKEIFSGVSPESKQGRVDGVAQDAASAVASCIPAPHPACHNRPQSASRHVRSVHMSQPCRRGRQSGLRHSPRHVQRSAHPKLFGEAWVRQDRSCSFGDETCRQQPLRAVCGGGCRVGSCVYADSDAGMRWHDGEGHDGNTAP